MLFVDNTEIKLLTEYFNLIALSILLIASLTAVNSADWHGVNRKFLA